MPDATDAVSYNVGEKFNKRIGGEGAIDFFTIMREFIDENPNKIIILDFCGVDFVDSSGLGSLCAINSILIKKNRELIIANAPDNLMDLLKITNLDRILKFENTKKWGEDYVRSCRKEDWCSLNT